MEFDLRGLTAHNRSRLGAAPRFVLAPMPISALALGFWKWGATVERPVLGAGSKVGLEARDLSALYSFFL